jgi:hypothetical protein
LVKSVRYTFSTPRYASSPDCISDRLGLSLEACVDVTDKTTKQQSTLTWHSDQQRNKTTALDLLHSAKHHVALLPEEEWAKRKEDVEQERDWSLQVPFVPKGVAVVSAVPFVAVPPLRWEAGGEFHLFVDRQPLT